MKDTVTVIFDIGKTNKKFFLFDENLEEIAEEYVKIPEIKDDDGYACDDLAAIEAWIAEKYKSVSSDTKYRIKAINFSTYGASLVHLGSNGKSVTPFYNYTKPFSEALLQEFYAKYDSKEQWATETASPPLGMLNSGLQLYFLKYQKPELFKEITCSLHLPQYMSYLFSGKLTSEYTSIGCHTGLWNFEQKNYHNWVYEEKLYTLLPEIVPNATFFEKNGIKIGVGIHDSSSALLPYLKKSAAPFVLISTGTWCICINPFNPEPLTISELENDCLNFMQTDGKPVKASRLFMGNEYNLQTEKLAKHFGKENDFHKKVKFDKNLLKYNEKRIFVWQSLKNQGITSASTDLSSFENYESAYHILMQELMDLQVEKLRLALGSSKVKKIYVDGGFADNELYINILKGEMQGFEIIPTQIPLGSAWGAASLV
ncbi:MAG: carbohydrate kinase [Verrucomicrobia bacterium]|nr:carbohydrate kinase [Cytophagales bacterium]